MVSPEAGVEPEDEALLRHLRMRWVEPGRPPRPVELDLVFRTERHDLLDTTPSRLEDCGHG